MITHTRARAHTHTPTHTHTPIFSISITPSLWTASPYRRAGPGRAGPGINGSMAFRHPRRAPAPLALAVARRLRDYRRRTQPRPQEGKATLGRPGPCHPPAVLKCKMSCEKKSAGPSGCLRRRSRTRAGSTHRRGQVQDGEVTAPLDDIALIFSISITPFWWTGQDSIVVTTVRAGRSRLGPVRSWLDRAGLEINGSMATHARAPTPPPR